MKKFRILLAVLALLSVNLGLKAQDITVTLTSVQQVLPPQALLYMSDPGKYFNITLINNTQSVQDVYLAMDLEQVMPQSGLSISTPPRRQPQQPYSLSPGQVRQLTMVEMKTLFNHIPKNEIKASSGLLDNFSNGAFGLLPEGQYKAQITAYKWSQNITNPVALSNPAMGACYFTICYKAQAPEFLMPTMNGGGGLIDLSVATLDPLVPMFTWKAPLLACNPAAATFTYDFKIVELLPNQQPDQAIDRNAAVYQVKDLLAPMVTLPVTYVNQLYLNKTYVAQVQAHQTGTSANMLNYVMLENNGKSPFMLFKVKDPDNNNTPEEKQEEEEDHSGGGESDEMSGEDMERDSLYVFKAPIIEHPLFEENETRKLFLEDAIGIDWRPAAFKQGRGSRQDTVKIEYHIELYRATIGCNRDSLFKTEPLYAYNAKNTSSHTIDWKILEEKEVKHDDYMILRIVPKSPNTKSVRFVDDASNIVDFAMSMRLTKTYFKCSNSVQINNLSPTKKSAKDLKDQVVAIGEYELTIDKISGDGKKGFTGEGRVKWQPLGATIMVCVKFDNLKINTDDIVYEGDCVTYAEDPNSSNFGVVEKLFSDWGIDNYIGDAFLSGASSLQQSSGSVKDLAKKIDLSKYYQYVKTGNTALELITSGKVDKFYMPAALPKSINKSPVDIQISKMRFAPDYATMDLIGEFALPNTNWTKNDILVLGAPRLCISPNRFLPEAGTIALLSDFNIKDPKSSYEMNFKAPENVMEPKDGCYIAWKADELEIFGIDVDMTIPKLVKDNNGVATNEKPIVNIRASVASWDDWMVDNVSIDPFQVEDMPGWTFTASDIVYDHSLYRNSTKMAPFPKGYSKAKTDITTDNEWQGLFIGQVGLQFPKTLEMGDKGDGRLELKTSNMFFDKSGATLDVAAYQVLSAKTGKVGGWSLTIDKIGLSFVQNDFTNCHFGGKFSVPLLKGTIGYDCRIIKQTSNTGNAGQFAYVFKAQQIENQSLDFMLAKVDFNEDQTYFLVESLPTTTGQDTKVELLMGGEITIGGTDYLNQKIKDSKLPMKFEIPGVHFCGMRLANCPNTWVSTYEKTMQSNAKKATLEGKSLYSGKEIVLSSGKIYFHTGRWSLASDQKKLGPFDFSIDKYDMSYSSNTLKTSIKGSITLVSGIELSAGAGLTISSKVTLPKDLSNLTDISIAYEKTQFDEASFGTKFADMELSGKLTAENDNPDREGYKGSLTFKMPGNLFYIDANGGYFKNKTGNKQFTYGWFYAAAGGKAGIPIDPLKIHRLSAGFYYNCRKVNDGAEPEEALIGVVAGLGLSTTAGESLLSGDLDMTVIYNKKKNGFSTFLFTGEVKAVEGLVKAKANVLYQNDTKDQYLKIDVTVDAKADSEKITEKIGGSNITQSLGDLKKKLNSSYTGITKRLAEDGLEKKISDTKDNYVPPTKAPKEGEEIGASAGSSISVQFMVTMKKDGQKLSKAKWHVYLGEPDVDHRCWFQYLKINSPIVKVDIGANGYVCVGNELPNNGMLPEIPDKIRQFLNGSRVEGIESADVSKANAARQQALNEFNAQAAQNGGGVMFGGQVWGYFDVDLGIFYMDAGATAGFDVSLVKLSATSSCTNIQGDPGWHRWYGYGQLYAYLYAKFGIKLDLGFWSTHFDVANAGIGGVFRMQGPKPTHFDGEARVKLKLLGGLVDINRKYSFSAGDECDLFMGNALDEFKLFGDLSIGHASKDQGWAEKNQLNPKLLSKPCLYTEAPLNEPFRVLDETELARLKKNYSGDASALEMEASRTFIFRSNVGSQVTLWEYKSQNDKNPTRRDFKISGQSRYANYINITELEPNRFYAMTVSGYAKEIQKGAEVNPVYYDEKTKRYTNKSWYQSKTYYFCTGPKKVVEDIPDLQEYIAIAYPSNYNRIMLTNQSALKLVWAHKHDVQRPNFALTADISQKAFQKGKLMWRLYDSQGNKLLCERENEWVVTDNTCNMRPKSDLTNFICENQYVLTLEYDVSTGKAGRIYTTTTVLASMAVYPFKSDWKKGKISSTTKKPISMNYETPFVGCRIDDVTMLNGFPVGSNGAYSDYDVATSPTHLLMDPYMYIAALSNYIFPGGWQFTGDRLDVNITTAQSVVYTDKGGVYEGKLGGNEKNYNCLADYAKIKKLSIYDWLQYEKITPYPLPMMDGEYGYALPGLERAAAYTPSSKNYVRVANYISNMYQVYAACEDFSINIKEYCYLIDANHKMKIGGTDFTARANRMQNWYNAHRGRYVSGSFGPARLQVPAYQFPILYGACLDNKGAKSKITLWGTLAGYEKQCKGYAEARGHQNVSQILFSTLLGSDNIGNYVSKKNKRSWAKFVNNDNMKKAMKRAKFTIYRVNAYDFNNCRYTVEDKMKHANIPDKETFTIDNPLTYYHKE